MGTACTGDERCADGICKVTHQPSPLTCTNGPLPVVAAADAGTAQSGRGSEKSFDGLGHDSGDDNARWALDGMPTEVVFDLGGVQRLCVTRFSFYNFDAGRSYVYSVAHSVDGGTFQTVLDHASSALSEWTQEAVAPAQARYVKLILHSATPETNWAGLWEAQFLGDITRPVEPAGQISSPVKPADENFIFHQDNDALPLSDPVLPEVLGPAYDYSTNTAGVNGNIAVVEDPLKDPARGHVLKFIVPGNKFSGARSVGPELNLIEPELYAAYDFFIEDENEDHFPQLPSGSKLSGFFSYSHPPGGKDVSGGGDARTGWSYRLMYYTPKPYSSLPANSIAVGTYQYYWAHNGLPLGDRRTGKAIIGSNPTRTDTAAGPPNPATSAVSLVRGQWNKIMIRCKPNTTPGDASTGLTELWINGFKALSNNKIEYVPSMAKQNFQLEPGENANNYYKFRSFKFHLYHGGSAKWQSPDPVTYYMDNMTVSRQPIPGYGE